MGIPCSHQLKDMISNRRKVRIEDFDQQWLLCIPKKRTVNEFEIVKFDESHTAPIIVDIATELPVSPQSSSQLFS